MFKLMLSVYIMCFDIYRLILDIINTQVVSNELVTLSMHSMLLDI